MAANLSFKELTKLVEDGSIDTVVAAIPDMQGRLMGKRFQAQYFVDTAWEESHCCKYLVATDLEMTPVENYKSTSWSSGHGDYVMKPDLSTMRRLPWLKGTAFVLCDLLDHATHKDIPHSPRAVLKKQLARLAEHGLTMTTATELEFFIFRESFEQMQDHKYHDMTPVSPYNEDYHIFQTTREEGVMQPIRNGLYGAGIRVESSKGEADPGQVELNIHYSDALDMADTHVLVKNAVKEIAWQNGRSVTFMAKWHHSAAGSSGHIHQSLCDKKGKSVFFDPKAKHGMSKLMQQALAGMLKHVDETTFFLAPYVNSYKRFAAGTFAPTSAVWSVDNRTAGYRVVSPGTDAVRVECRIGGADMNPYLALAAQIASMLAGIDGKLKLEPEFSGNAYGAEETRRIPKNLRAATAALRGSTMLREAMGDDVIDHYVRSAEWEQEDFDRVVTDYEVRRGFERA
ncbi:glutamine synthetase family protein [Allohahella sp. A8]|uniref:glutamine synthetase family protein n=1 Tax=Allohahella sp. A8 TaxID=3141461 RepID=UPI000C0B6C61|nr:glutamine synthetase [Hahellaceae bacterium]|tara:strand:+ start:139014 stop:140381 length:1368 start_codon:yes stop_codon:yes gene_type:complete